MDLTDVTILHNYPNLGRYLPMYFQVGAFFIVYINTCRQPWRYYLHTCMWLLEVTVAT